MTELKKDSYSCSTLTGCCSYQVEHLKLPRPFNAFSQTCESGSPRTICTVTPTPGAPKNDSATARTTTMLTSLGILSFLTSLMAIALSCLPDRRPDLWCAGNGARHRRINHLAAAVQQSRPRHASLRHHFGCAAICATLLLCAAMGSFSSFVPSALFRSLYSIVDVPVLSAMHDVQASINAAAIANACAAYAKTHNSRYPPHLAVLVIDGSCDVESLHVPGGTANIIDTSSLPKSETDWPKIAAIVESGSDFEYVGADLPTELHRDESKLITVYSKTTLHDGSRVLPDLQTAQSAERSFDPTEFRVAKLRNPTELEKGIATLLALSVNFDAH